MAKTQLSIPGTERKINKKVAAKGEALADTIAKLTKARLKKHDAEVELIAMMRSEDVLEYVDTDVEPPIWIVLEAKDKVTMKKWRAPKDNEEGPQAAA